MKKYKFFNKDVIIEKQQQLQSQKMAIAEKISMQQKEIKQSGSSQICISEDESHLAQMRLHTQIDQQDIYTFSNDDISKIQNAIENGYRIEYTSHSGNSVSTGLYIPKQGAFFLFMINCGIRAGEAVALKYSDFDLDAGTVRIQRNAVNVKERDQYGNATGRRNRTFTTPKTTKSNTVLQLSPYATQIIRDMQTQEPPGYDSYVVHSKSSSYSRKNTLAAIQQAPAGCRCAAYRAAFHTAYPRNKIV